MSDFDEGRTDRYTYPATQGAAHDWIARKGADWNQDRRDFDSPIPTTRREPMTEALAVREQIEALPVAVVVQRVKDIQHIKEAVMQENSHYGVIPGTNKPTLYKAGAEILLETFNIAADPIVEDLSAGDTVRLRVVTRLLSSSGRFLGAGVGEASSAEDKYQWRVMVCQEEFDATPEDRKRIKWQTKYGKVQAVKQVRTNPADIANTILKMAKKRSLVDATLTVTAASDMFTQDVEDMPAEIVNSGAAQEETPRRQQDEGGENFGTCECGAPLSCKQVGEGKKNTGKWFLSCTDWKNCKVKRPWDFRDEREDFLVAPVVEGEAVDASLPEEVTDETWAALLKMQGDFFGLGEKKSLLSRAQMSEAEALSVKEEWELALAGPFAKE